VPRTLRVRLFTGMLKVKHREKLNFEERTGHYWMRPLGKYRLIWCPDAAPAPRETRSR
jgi:hypothetical protein